MRYGHIVMSLFCAWVLWATPFDKTTEDQSASISALNGFENRDNCLKEVRSLANGTAMMTVNDKFIWKLCLPSRHR